MSTKPSVTKKFKESVFPTMEKSGFKALNTKLFCRIADGEILQFISIHVNSTLRRETNLEFGSFLLATPQASFTMDIGGRFTKGSSAGSYGAVNENMLAKSMERILVAYEEEVYPQLKQSETIESLIAKKKELKDSAPHLYNNGHTELSIASALSLIDKKEEAKKYCASSIQNFSRLYQEEPIREWAIEGKNIAKGFLDELKTSTEKSTLERWKSETIQTLKLKKVTT